MAGQSRGILDAEAGENRVVVVWNYKSSHVTDVPVHTVKGWEMRLLE